MAMRMVLLLLAAAAGAHDAWKPPSVEISREGALARVTLRLDLPALLAGKPPAEAQDAEMDVALAGDEALAARLASLAARWPGMVELEVDGRRLPLRVAGAPDVAAVRAEQAAARIGQAYPLMMPVRLEADWPGEPRRVRLRLDALLGPPVTRLRLEPERLDFLSAPAGEWSATVELAGPPRGAGETGAEFLARGFGHVLPDGWDHALFMLTLFLGAGSARSALGRSAAFTAGHTATIALVWTGWAASPGPWIEPLIAGSIAAAALAVALGRSVAGGAAAAWALGFGLLHGMGFAAAADLPTDGGAGLAAALLGFNLGVEAAQLLVIAGAAALLWPWRERPWYEGRARRPLAWAAAAGGLALLASRL